MLKNYLKISIRALFKQRGFTAINIVGLTLGLTCSMLILLWVADEMKFDRIYKDGERIFCVFFNMEFPGQPINTWQTAPWPLKEALETEYAEIERVAVVSDSEDKLLTLGDQNVKKPGVFACEDILGMFNMPLIAGDKNSALKDKGSIVITDELAEILFGIQWRQKDILGKSILIEKEDHLMITGVVPKLNRNSSIQFDYLIPFEFGLDKQPWNREWYNYTNRMFVKLREEVNVKEFNQKIKDVIKKHRKDGGGDDSYAFVYPIEDLHLKGNFENGVTIGGRIQYVRIFSAVSAFVLILACINFTNLSTARSFRRAKEVGIRKAVGAGRKSLVFQFIGESIIMTLFSMVLAVLLTSLLLPTFNLFTGKDLFLDYKSPMFWMYGLIFLLMTGLLSGFYPALFISNFKPVKALKGSLIVSHHTGFLRRALVVFQFFLSIFMIIGTIVVHLQIDLIMAHNLGLEKENVLIYSLNRESYAHHQAIKTDLLQRQEFVNVTTCDQNPLAIGASITNLSWEGKKEGEDIEFDQIWVSFDFTKTLGMQMAAGRDFSPAVASDSLAFLVNEAAVKAMGIENPIGYKFSGQWIRNGKIIGVIKDFHSASIYNPIRPMMAIIDPEPDEMYIRVAAAKTQQAIQQLEKLHKKYSPSYPFEYKFMNEQYDQLYKSEVVMGKLSSFFALVAIVISCLGLIGLASLTIAQKVKEIGIRKVFGASIASILFLLSRDYVKLILIAFIISVPVANYFITEWLEKFQYKISLNWGLYLIAGAMVLAIALLVVSGQSFKAATANPADSLRNE